MGRNQSSASYSRRVEAAQPLFLLGDPKDYACLRPNRPMIVYGKEDIEAIKRFTPDFHAIGLPPIIFDRAHDRSYVEWSTGWAGGHVPVAADQGAMGVRYAPQLDHLRAAGKLQ